MASEETGIFNAIRIAISKLFKTRLFRINTGRAWTGNKIYRDGKKLIIEDPRPFSTGTPAGYADGTGWTTIEITPSMVGKDVAVFTAIEAKTKRGRVSKDQQNFIEQVQKAGGIAGVARSADDAVEIIQKYKNSCQ